MSKSANTTPLKGKAPTPRGTPRKTPRGPTPADSETIYHKQIRAYLQEHRRYKREWNELVLRGCVGRCRACIDIWEDVENTLKRSKEIQSFDVRSGYLRTQARRLHETQELIRELEEALGNVVRSMDLTVGKAEALVAEASDTKGLAFPLKEPLWLTWPLERFATGLATLTEPYRRSLNLIHSLLKTLTTFPPLPIDESWENVALSDRPSSEEIQASMSLLALQPLIPDKSMASSYDAWEDILSVEVGSWD